MSNHLVLLLLSPMLQRHLKLQLSPQTLNLPLIKITVVTCGIYSPSHSAPTAISTGSTDFVDDPAIFSDVFSASASISLLLQKSLESLESLDKSVVVQQFFKELFWYLYLRTVSLSYISLSAFLTNSALHTTKIRESGFEIISTLCLLLLGPSSCFPIFQLSPPCILVEDALLLPLALPPNSAHTSNDNVLYLIYLFLPVILQREMEDLFHLFRPTQSPSELFALLTAFSHL